MEIEDFIKWTLGKEGFSCLRDKISEKHEWLYHSTPENCLSSILSKGLEPRYPGGRPSEYIVETKGEEALNLLCFSPAPSGMLFGSGFGATPRRTLAIKRTDFPRVAAVDWSFGDAVKILKGRIKNEKDFLVAASIAVECFASNQSFAFYDGVSPDKIRIMSSLVTSTDPEEWQLLEDFLAKPNAVVT